MRVSVAVMTTCRARVSVIVIPPSFWTRVMVFPFASTSLLAEVGVAGFGPPRSASPPPNATLPKKIFVPLRSVTTHPVKSWQLSYIPSASSESMTGTKKPVGQPGLLLKVCRLPS